MLRFSAATATVPTETVPVNCLMLARRRDEFVLIWAADVTVHSVSEVGEGRIPSACGENRRVRRVRPGPKSNTEYFAGKAARRG